MNIPIRYYTDDLRHFQSICLKSDWEASQIPSGWLRLSTCQRKEAFGFGDHALAMAGAEVLTGRDAFLHLVRIATGLESRMLGELEILGQVRSAYRSARDEGVEAPLDQLLQAALRIARTVRRISRIDQQRVSLGSLAARIALRNIDTGAGVAILGAGSLAGQVLRYLSRRSSSPVHLIARRPDQAACLLNQGRGRVVGFDHLQETLSACQAVVCATSSQVPVLAADQLGPLARVVVDLGVPPDCDRHVGNYCHLVSLKDVEAEVAHDWTERVQCATHADQLVRFAVLGGEESAQIGNKEAFSTFFSSIQSR